MKKQLNFKIVSTHEQAAELCNDINTHASYYMRKNHPATFTPWSSSDGKETGFVVWYRV